MIYEHGLVGGVIADRNADFNNELHNIISDNNGLKYVV